MVLILLPYLEKQPELPGPGDGSSLSWVQLLEVKGHQQLAQTGLPSRSRDPVAWLLHLFHCLFLRCKSQKVDHLVQLVAFLVICPSKFAVSLFWGHRSGTQWLSSATTSVHWCNGHSHHTKKLLAAQSSLGIRILDQVVQLMDQYNCWL